MEKIIKFIANHDKAIYIFSNIMIIILGFCFMGNMVLNGFTAEQLDEPSVVCGFIVFFTLHSFLNIFHAFLYKPKSDKE